MNPSEHIPVLKELILKAFEDLEISSFIDATLGAGGHASLLLSRHPEIKKYYGLDQDPEAISLASAHLSKWQDTVEILKGNFENSLFELEKTHKGQIDGILMDLGVSSMQLDRREKGFSFRFEGPLDMRMNPEESLTAFEIVNTYDVKELTRIFKVYGEEPKAFLAAKAICKARNEKPIATTKDLADLIEKALGKNYKKLHLHPATLIFQALRLAVNRELEVLEKALPLALSLLKPKGRLAVISFHSLEDRIVKQFFQQEALDKERTSGLSGLFIDKDPTIKILSRKPLIADDEEIKLNPRSRSAKLRVIEKI